MKDIKKTLSGERTCEWMKKSNNLVMIIGGVLYSVITDWSLSLGGLGKLCKDLIPLASIVYGYYLGKLS